MPYLILCLISALLAGSGAWKYQAQKHELALANLSTYYLKRDFRALENANAETTRLQNQKDAALRTAAQRQRFWQSQNSALERDVDGLRSDLASYRAEREPLPGDPATPELPTPLPSKPYSETVQLKLSEWKALLKATRTTSRP